MYICGVEIFSMSLTELLPSVQALPRADKAKLAQLLIADLAAEQHGAKNEIDYPMWTPYNTTEAAATMLKALAESKTVG
jgi:hypothetical protein